MVEKALTKSDDLVSGLSSDTYVSLGEGPYKTFWIGGVFVFCFFIYEYIRDLFQKATQELTVKLLKLSHCILALIVD